MSNLDQSTLSQLEPISALSPGRLQELASLCFVERVSKDIDPMRMNVAKSAQAMYLINGDLGLRYADGSKKILRTISDLVVLSFAVGMIIYGITLMQLQWAEKMPSLGISGAFRYLPLAAGGVLIALFSIERIVLRWAGVDVDKDPHLEDVPDVADAREI